MSEFAVTRADQAADAEYLSSLGREADPEERRRSSKILHGVQRLLARFVGRAWVEVLDLSSNHQRDHVPGRRRRRQLTGLPTIAQDGNAIGHVGDLVQPMGDVDHGVPAGLERPHDPEETLRFFGGEGRRRLI